MDKPKDGGPAFPVPDSHYANGQVQYGANGMSLRDWFAGQALQGYNANREQCAHMSHEQAAKSAYLDADAMLAARERENTHHESDGRLLELLKTHPLAKHPLNGNDEGKPCICSSCEWVRAVESHLNGKGVAK